MEREENRKGEKEWKGKLPIPTNSIMEDNKNNFKVNTHF